jgi:hypothetical protein
MDWCEKQKSNCVGNDEGEGYGGRQINYEGEGTFQAECSAATHFPNFIHAQLSGPHLDVTKLATITAAFGNGK